MRPSARATALLLAALSAPLLADEPPEIEHQPVPCTIPNKAVSVCATVTDDGQVAKARVYFRKSGEDFFAFVDMVFVGLKYCGTLPAPREGKLDSLEYYVQAIDDQYQSKRLSTYAIAVKPEGACDFPAVETDAARASRIVVFATHKKQGKKLDDAFLPTGVTFVPIQAK
jgi:hypothetical protein